MTEPTSEVSMSGQSGGNKKISRRTALGLGFTAAGGALVAASKIFEGSAPKPVGSGTNQALGVGGVEAGAPQTSYYLQEGSPGTLVEDAVDEAYAQSLHKHANCSTEEAKIKKHDWVESIPGMVIVVTSIDRGVEVFDGVRTFQETALKDSNRYPTGYKVAIAKDPDNQSGGESLSAYAFREINKSQAYKFYEWGQKEDGSYGVIDNDTYPDNRVFVADRIRYLHEKGN